MQPLTVKGEPFDFVNLRFERALTTNKRTCQFLTYYSNSVNSETNISPVLYIWKIKLFFKGTIMRFLLLDFAAISSYFLKV